MYTRISVVPSTWDYGAEVDRSEERFDKVLGTLVVGQECRRKQHQLLRCLGVHLRAEQHCVGGLDMVVGAGNLCCFGYSAILGIESQGDPGLE